MNVIDPKRVDEPLDRPCPSCESDLVVENRDGPRMYVVCPDCDYTEYEPHRGAWGWTLDPLRDAYADHVWPYRPVLCPLLFVLGIGIAVFGPNGGSTLVLGGLVAAVAILLPDVRGYCRECGNRVGESDLFCPNCGASATEPFYPGRHDEPLTLPLFGDPLRLGPFEIERNWLSLEIRTERHGSLLEAIVGGREREWRRVLDFGVVVGAVGYLAALSVILFVVVSLFLTPGVVEVLGQTGPVPEDPPELHVPLELVLGVAVAITVLVATNLVHELGHGIALYANGHDVGRIGFILLLGVIPEAAYVKEAMDWDGDLSLRTALHVDAGGVLAELLVVLPVVAWVALVGLPPGYLGWAALGAVIGAGVGVLNLVPMHGFDGYRFQTHVLAWVFESRGVASPDQAWLVSGVGSIVLFGALLLGVVL